MNILVTGGCGFIGSHFIELVLREHGEDFIVNLDAMTYAAHPQTEEHLERVGGARYQFLKMDIASPNLPSVLEQYRIDAIVNFAAESHVDRSILEPESFARTNILGLQNILSAARTKKNVRVVQVSTDEVYGSLEPGAPTSEEDTPLSPNSPYAASKAGADLLALANYRTYGQPVLITRCTNNYGPRQFPEKLLPLVIANALEEKAIPVYGDGRQVRDWIFVVDHCRAVDLVLRKGVEGEIYNISASEERPNLEVIRKVVEDMGKSLSLLQHVGDRPAHDRRYGLNPSKIRESLGWRPSYSFEEGLAITIAWYLENTGWWRSLRDGEYLKYYEANYRQKFVESSLST